MDLFEWSQNIMKVDQNKVINDRIKWSYKRQNVQSI